MTAILSNPGAATSRSMPHEVRADSLRETTRILQMTGTGATPSTLFPFKPYRYGFSNPALRPIVDESVQLVIP